MIGWWRARRQARCDHQVCYGYLAYGGQGRRRPGVYCDRCEGYLGSVRIWPDGTRIEVEVHDAPEGEPTLSELSRLTPRGNHGGLNRAQRRALAREAVRRS